MATRPLQTITLKNEGGDNITYTLSGEYPDLTAGSAEQIISDDYTENKVPYLLRASNFGSKREDDTLVGGTVAFNQTAPKGGGTANVGTKQYNAETGITTITPANYTTDNVGLYGLNDVARIVGHKYYVSADVYADYAVQIKMGFNVTAIKQNISATTWTRVDGVQSYASASLTVYAAINSAGWASGTFKIRNVMCFDLTQMFGSTIADYIYSLEQATTGAGAAWFKALFPAPYYAYNAGELKSVEGVSAHKMVGFNAWDEEWEVGGIDASTGANIADSTVISSKNFIPVIAGATYYVKNGSNATVVVHRYDASKNYLGNNNRSNETIALSNDTHYIKLRFGTAYGTTYKHDTCINLSSSRNGEYEPYKAMSYPLDSSLTLRGIPKLDANNNLYYDGDTYESDGTVTRKYQQRAYQVGDEALADAITDGTNTVVKLVAPTTETADPFTNPQNVDPDGTEEYVSTSIVPVGHETKYFADLVERLAAIPNPPTANGTYRLIATVSGGVATLSWVTN